MGNSLLDFISAHSREDSIDKLFYDAIVTDDDDVKVYESSKLPPSSWGMLAYEYGALLRSYCIENPEISESFHYKDWESLIHEVDWKDRLDWMEQNKQNIVETGFSGLYLGRILDQRDTVDNRWHLAYQYGGNALARAILADKVDWLQEMYQKDLEDGKVLTLAN